MPFSSASCLLMSISKPRLNEKSCTDILCAALYEHCGRNFEYYKCISQPNNGTFSQNFFSVHSLLCCTVLVFTASGKGAQAIGSFTASSYFILIHLNLIDIFQLRF